MRYYVYKPQPRFIDRQWTTTGHVYIHLINKPGERERIMSEISALDRNQPFTAVILHPLLSGHLTYSTVESDSRFLHRIENLLEYEEGRGNLVTGPPLVCADSIKIFYKILTCCYLSIILIFTSRSGTIILRFPADVEHGSSICKY